MNADLINLLQWPAMAVTLAGAWLVSSSRESRRHWGFYVYILSNVLWCVWAWHTSAWALIALQVGLFIMNLRGADRNED